MPTQSDILYHSLSGDTLFLHSFNELIKLDLIKDIKFVEDLWDLDEFNETLMVSFKLRHEFNIRIGPHIFEYEKSHFVEQNVFSKKLLNTFREKNICNFITYE